MKSMIQRKIQLLTCFFSVILSGCAALPDSIKTDNYHRQISFETLKKSDDIAPEEQVVLGGKIISINNLTNTSEIEILQLPANYYGRPDDDTRMSDGRFIATFEGLLDPAVYEEGELISVRGIYEGKREGFIGDHPYTFVVIKSDGLHIWEPRTEAEFHYVIGIGSGSPFSRSKLYP